MRFWISSLFIILSALPQSRTVAQSGPATLKLQVLNAGTLKPIAGVRLGIRVAPADPTYAYSDDAGIVEIKYLQRATYGVTVEDERYILPSYRASSPVPSSGSRSFTPTAGESRTIPLPLMPVSTISGQVRDANGKPIIGARVAIGVL